MENIKEKQTTQDSIPHVFWKDCAKIVGALSLLKFSLFFCYLSTDFDVHRNWLAITWNLPMRQWYLDATSEWTLDYPPFFAYFELLLASLASSLGFLKLDPDMMNIQAEPYRSQTTIFFQRASVLFVDMCLACATAWYVSRVFYPREHLIKVIIFLLVVANPGLLIVDSIHFQYNNILFCLLFFSMGFIETRNEIVGAFFFAVLLNVKHLFLSVSLVYFVYLLKVYCVSPVVIDDELSEKSSSLKIFITRLFKLSVVVGAVFAVSLGPFVVIFGQTKQLLARLFPFGRGLTHAYWAPNIWALYNFSDKVLSFVFKSSTVRAASTSGLIGDDAHAVLPDIAPILCILLTLFSLVPCLIKLWRNPNPKLFVCALSVSAFCFYYTGFHIHEKQILTVIIPLTALVWKVEFANIWLFLSIIGHYSLLPLLYQSSETITKLSIFVGYSLLSYGALKLYHGRSRNSKFGLSVWQQFFVLGLFGVQTFVSVLHPLVFPPGSFQFLPLMIISVYCSIGISISYLQLYLAYLSW